MRKLCSFHQTGGASLVEVLLAVAILVISVSALSYYYPISMRAITEARHRNSASALANSKLEQMKMQPYGTVRLLPASNFPNPTNCDCRTIDFASATLDPAFSETVVNGPITYQRKVCVNRMQRTVTGDLVPQCNNWSDTGLKNIVVAVSWKTGNQPKTVVTETMLSLQSQPVNGSLASTMTVTVCGAQLANPTQCDNAKQAAINATTTVSLVVWLVFIVALFTNGMFRDFSRMLLLIVFVVLPLLLLLIAALVFPCLAHFAMDIPALV